MLLVAFATWEDALSRTVGLLHVQGDAQGVLQAAITRRARNAQLNLIIAEMQIYLGAAHHDMYATHFWAEDNELCDALSRLPEGAHIPEELSQVAWAEPVRAEWALLKPSGDKQRLLEEVDS